MTNRAKAYKGLVLAVVGPTAVGKTRLAVKLARRIKGEIVSCDSMQVYKGMQVLSQAPSPAERNKIPHHLIATLSPTEEHSVASFRRKATKLIASIIKRKKIPIMVGGSGLYVKALIDGLFPSPEADVAFRRKMETYASKCGTKRLHAKLSKIDPASAETIHPNDKRRIIRSLEIYNSTGKTMTELKRQTKGIADEYRVKLFGLTCPRGKLYDAINSRVDAMLRSGAMSEVKLLSKKRLSKTARAALGIKELGGYLYGKCDLNEAAELLKRNTRRFAKRQFTWFRADKRIKWFDLSKLSDKQIVSAITKGIR